MNYKQALNQIGTSKDCVVVAIIKNKKVLILFRNYGPNEWGPDSVWTFPGGRCDQGEKIGTTLKRETKEEIGISDLIIEKYLGEFSGAKAGDKVRVFLGKTSQTPKICEPHKFSDLKWVKIANLPDSFINKTIKTHLLMIK